MPVARKSMQVHAHSFGARMDYGAVFRTVLLYCAAARQAVVLRDPMCFRFRSTLDNESPFIRVHSSLVPVPPSNSGKPYRYCIGGGSRMFVFLGQV